MSEEYNFLTFEDICQIHDDQLARYGGRDGILDENVVRSSLAAPQMELQYGGDNIAHVAASYLYHFAVNQGFVDGNKRVSVVASEAFLEINGYDLAASDSEIYDLTKLVANKLLGKTGVQQWFDERLVPLT